MEEQTVLPVYMCIYILHMLTRAQNSPNIEGPRVSSSKEQQTIAAVNEFLSSAFLITFRKFVSDVEATSGHFFCDSSFYPELSMTCAETLILPRSTYIEQTNSQQSAVKVIKFLDVLRFLAATS